MLKITPSTWSANAYRGLRAIRTLRLAGTADRDGNCIGRFRTAVAA